MVSRTGPDDLGITKMRFLVETRCECSRETGKWAIKIVRFYVVAHMEIPVGIHGTTVPRKKKDIQDSFEHEQKHAAHVRDWYDKNVVAIRRDLDTDYVFPDLGSCASAERARKDHWLSEWRKFTKGETQHTNPGWEGFQPANPEFPSFSDSL